MAGGEVLLSVRDVHKDYHGLRPLRIRHLELRAGNTIALMGLDRAAAQILVDLLTAAILPDDGDVTIFGTSSRDVTDHDTWLRLLDRIGILAERVVLLDEMTVEQNLALSLSVDIIDLSADLRRQAERLGGEVGIADADMGRPAAAVDAATRARLRLAKALALNPKILLAEHPNAMVPSREVNRFASRLSEIATARGLAMVVSTADPRFARAACRQVLTWQPATGEISAVSRWKLW